MLAYTILYYTITYTYYIVILSYIIVYHTMLYCISIILCYQGVPRGRVQQLGQDWLPAHGGPTII